MKYIRRFENYSDFENVKDDLERPNLSLIDDDENSKFEILHHIDYSTRYLTFETIEDSTFKLTRTSTEYSLDNGQTWISLNAETNTSVVSAGNKIMFKATNPTISDSYGIGTFSSTGKFNVGGNIMSLLYGDEFENRTDLSGNSYVFRYLFRGCNIVNANNLILPATTLATHCYDYMFYSCTSLVTVPELPATTLANGCYYNMFSGCSKLNYIKMLATDISATICLSNWVSGVSSTGTFIKNKDMSSLPTGTSGIPSGWTVVDYQN